MGKRCTVNAVICPDSIFVSSTHVSLQVKVTQVMMEFRELEEQVIEALVEEWLVVSFSLALQEKKRKFYHPVFLGALTVLVMVLVVGLGLSGSGAGAGSGAGVGSGSSSFFFFLSR